MGDAKLFIVVMPFFVARRHDHDVQVVQLLIHAMLLGDDKKSREIEGNRRHLQIIDCKKRVLGSG